MRRLSKEVASALERYLAARIEFDKANNEWHDAREALLELIGEPEED